MEYYIAGTIEEVYRHKIEMDLERIFPLKEQTGDFLEFCDISNKLMKKLDECWEKDDIKQIMKLLTDAQVKEIFRYDNTAGDFGQEGYGYNARYQSTISEYEEPETITLSTGKN
ncbi:MAG: hypothetical protein Harvfovirus3_69 [Harvfovirus sp.]|uniref:Uncharacterized protein n=1 Tax=Harvfovirus sp. TaxID=2487768 RepID=A0A3G5A289_9VIRU|nr:MAG: hypothetical protein Harvfovirus3_69 [Harvfovirus sp.]